MKMLKKIMAVALACVMAMAMFTACSMDDMTGYESATLMKNSVFGAGSVKLTADELAAIGADEVGVNNGYTYIKSGSTIYVRIDSKTAYTLAGTTATKIADSDLVSSLNNIDKVVNVKDEIDSAAHPDENTFIIGKATYKFDEKSNLTYFAYDGDEYTNPKAVAGPTISVTEKNDAITKITFDGTEYKVS